MEPSVDETCLAVTFNELHKSVTAESNPAPNIVYSVVICIGPCAGMTASTLYGDFA